MANFIHAREYLSKGDSVVVNCSHQCNVMLTIDKEFARYRSGETFNYYGGHFERFPATIIVPETGNWNVSIDLGGGAANIRYSINYIKR